MNNMVIESQLQFGELTTLLHVLCQQSSCEFNYFMIRSLLEKGANPNSRNTNGVTPLHIAAYFGNYEILELLLFNGGDPHHIDNKGLSPREYAKLGNSLSCCELLHSWTASVVQYGIDSPVKSDRLTSNNNTASCDSNANYSPKYFCSPVKLPATVKTESVLVTSANRKLTRSSSDFKPHSRNDCVEIDPSTNSVHTAIAEQRTHPQIFMGEQFVQLSDDAILSASRDLRKALRLERSRKSDSASRKLFETCSSVGCLCISRKNCCCKDEKLIISHGNISPPYAISSENGNVERMKIEGDVSVNDTHFNFCNPTDSDMEILNSLVNNSLCDAKQDNIESSKNLTFSSFKNLVQQAQTNEMKQVSVQQMEICRSYSDEEIRQKLLEYGIVVGPVVRSTRWIYENQLAQLLANDGKSVGNEDGNNYSFQLELALNGDLDVEAAEIDEQKMIERFSYHHNDSIINDSAAELNLDYKWRDGTRKICFCYLLLDPRLLGPLKDNASLISDHQRLRLFTRSIFYIGKGTGSRPYHHLFDAVKLQQTNRQKLTNNKILKIFEIWQAGYGIVPVFVFQNMIPAEAFTREAAMIEAIGLCNLTNRLRGNYYGLPSLWPLWRKARLGAYFLFKALQILLVEGVRELHAKDVIEA